MKYIDKQTGDEIEAIQWFGNNLTEVLNFVFFVFYGLTKAVFEDDELYFYAGTKRYNETELQRSVGERNVIYSFGQHRTEE